MSAIHHTAIGTTPSTRISGDSYEHLEPQLRELATLQPGTPEHAALRDRIIETALPLGEHIAQRYGGRGVDHDDLVQVAALGVVLSVDRFDPTLGSPFLGFAIPTVMGEVRRYFRDSTWAVRVPRRTKELRQQISVAIPELSQRLDREPTARELAAHLDTDILEVTQALIANNAYATQSLDARLPSDEADTAPALEQEVLAVTETGYTLMEDSITIGPLIAELPARERQILIMRYGQDMTQVQIGKALNISQMQVSRVLARTLAGLRDKALDEQALEVA
ncbi:SigB/SigF/SigG family RNA polymerase sigma factor [Nocardia sp. NPDC055321]